jgi:NAD(P)H-hydrate epimerase
MGRLLLVAGSRGMAGAAALSAEAAMRSGCGYVHVATVRAIAPELTAAVPSAILHCPNDRERARLFWDDLPMLVDAARSADAVVIGPGLGEGVEMWLGELLARATSPRVVLDADALNAIARRRELLAMLDERFALTPHAGEAARLLGWGNDRDRVEASRHAAISQLCTITRATVVLKGAGTMVARRGSPTVVNPTGNAGLAKAGSGDVLSGILGALLARGMHTYDAAIAAVWIHGRAADVLAQEVGEDSYISSDLARALGRAFSDYAAAVSAAP